MTGLQLSLVLGVVVGLGLAVMLYVLVPAQPDLRDVLTRLSPPARRRPPFDLSERSPVPAAARPSPSARPTSPSTACAAIAASPSSSGARSRSPSAARPLRDGPRFGADSVPRSTVQVGRSDAHQPCRRPAQRAPCSRRAGAEGRAAGVVVRRCAAPPGFS